MIGVRIGNCKNHQRDTFAEESEEFEGWLNAYRFASGISKKKLWYVPLQRIERRHKRNKGEYLK